MKKIFFVFQLLLLSISIGYSATNYTLEADKVIKKDNSTYIASGNVLLKTGDIEITADNVTYIQSSSRVIAVGNVKVKSPTQEIEADEIDYNMDDETGTATEIKGFLSPFHYICASNMQRTGATTFKVENARISTCSGIIPDWSIFIYRGNLDLEGSMQADHISVDIKNTPLIYLPKIAYPITSKRETGLLMPNGGFSNTKGAFLSLGYFIAPDINYDFTIAVNLFTKAGVQPMAEARYANSPENNFYAAGEWINDVSTKSGNTTRYKYTLKNSYSPIKDLTFTANGNNVSDYLYSRDFYKFSISQYYPRNKENIYFDEAMIDYNNTYADIRLYYRNDYMYRDQAQGYQLNRLEQMPSLVIEKVLPINNYLIIDYKAKYDNIYKANVIKGLDGITTSSESQSYNRIALDTKVYVPIDLQFVVLTPTIEFGYTYWNSKKTPFLVQDFQSDIFGAVKKIDDKNMYRYFGALSLVGSFREIYREYNKYFTHAILNTLTASYTPLLKQDGIPRIFSYDYIPPTGGLTYKMINYFYGEGWSNTLTLTQSVDILAIDLFSPLLANMITNIGGIVVNTFDITYKHSGALNSPTESRMQYISDDLMANITKYFYLFGSYAHDTRVVSSFNTSVRAGLGIRVWGIHLSAYNRWQGYNTDGFSNLITTGQGVTASYTAECWSLGFILDRNSYFSNYITGKVSRDEIIVGVSFSLRGIGDMKFQFTNTIDSPAN